MIIKHLGKEMNSSFYNGTIDKNIVETIRKGYYKEDKELALKQLRSILLNGKSKSNHTYNYYFERVANDTIVDNDKWSINQLLKSDELVYSLHNKVLANSEKTFPDKSKIVDNFKTIIRLGGKGIARKPTQFPIKTMRQLLDEFTKEGDLYYDPCMGWGMRMMCAAEKGLRYVGNDVNYDLMLKLKELKEDIQTIKPFRGTLIYRGSEIFEPRLVNKADFIFTSPPYFDLEQYNGSDNLKTQNYQQWLDLFMKPMLENCLQYIKNDKYVLINIKNTKKYNMYNDTLEIAKSLGYNYIGYRELKQANRKSSIGNVTDGTEKIMVLQKKDLKD